MAALVSLFFGKRDEERGMAWWAADVPPPGTRHVTENNATHLGPVYAAIRHIVDFGSTLPACAYRRIDEHTTQAASLPKILTRQDEPGMPGLEQWVGQALFGIVVHGNAVGWVTDFDGYGYPTDVRWLRRQDWQYDETVGVWRVFSEPVPRSQIFHIPWIVPTGHTVGLSPIDVAMATISAGLSAQDYADIKRGGGIPPSVLKNSKVQLDSEQAANIRERAVTAFTSGKPFVTGADWDLSLPTIPPNHAAFIETLRMSANSIAAMYGLDPTEVGGQPATPMTYVNDEARTLNRMANIRPYLERIEKAVNRALPNRLEIEFDTDRTIRTDVKTRTETMGWMISDGRRSVNEARAADGLPPVPGGDNYNIYTPLAAPAARPAQEPTRSAPSSEGDTP